MKKKIIFVSLILFVNFSFLFSGPPEDKGPESYCPHRYVRLNALMGIPVNCDEFTFIGAAAHPDYLLQQNFQRQGRPGYILFGTAFGYTIYYALYPFHNRIDSFIKQKLSGQFSQLEIQKGVLYGSVYTGFILLNVIILLLSMLLFEKIVFLLSGNWKNEQWLLWMCMIMLISNQVSKTFFWTAHQQMFAMFTPIACVYTGLRIYENKPRRKEIFLFSFVAGLLLLVYGNFLLLLPAILFSYCLMLKNQKKLFSISSILAAAVIVLIFFLPLSLWVLFLKTREVIFYSYEFSTFRQFVWIKDSLKISFTFFSKIFYNNTMNFLQTMGSLFLSILFLSSVLICFQIQKRNTKKIAKDQLVASLNKILSFTFLSFIIFLWMLGYYTDRLTFTIAPLLLIVAVAKMNAASLSLKIQLALASIIFLIHLYTVFFNAPHLSENLFFL